MAMSVAQKLAQKEEQLELLKSITNSISYNLDIDSVLTEIVTLVSTTMKADSCLIYLVDGKSLILKASKIPHKRMINQVVMQFGEGITGWVAEHKEAVIIDDAAYNDDRFKGVPRLSEDKWENFISVPITYQNHVVGVINVQNRKKTHYAADQISLLETIAAQVGGALSNAKLLSETRALKDALETRKVLDKAKGLLIADKNITEAEAHSIIQKKAMNSKRPLREVAEAIVLALG